MSEIIIKNSSGTFGFLQSSISLCQEKDLLAVEQHQRAHPDEWSDEDLKLWSWGAGIIRSLGTQNVQGFLGHQQSYKWSPLTFRHRHNTIDAGHFQHASEAWPQLAQLLHHKRTFNRWFSAVGTGFAPGAWKDSTWLHHLDTFQIDQVDLFIKRQMMDTYVIFAASEDVRIKSGYLNSQGCSGPLSEARLFSSLAAIHKAQKHSINGSLWQGVPMRCEMIIREIMEPNEHLDVSAIRSGLEKKHLQDLQEEHISHIQQQKESKFERLQTWLDEHHPGWRKDFEQNSEQDSVLLSSKSPSRRL